MKTACFRCIKC